MNLFGRLEHKQKLREKRLKIKKRSKGDNNTESTGVVLGGHSSDESENSEDESIRPKRARNDDTVGSSIKDEEELALRLLGV